MSGGFRIYTLYGYGSLSVVPYYYYFSLVRRREENEGGTRRRSLIATKENLNDTIFEKLTDSYAMIDDETG